MALLGAHPRRRECGHTRLVNQRDGQWLAVIPDHGLPALGPERILPVRWRFWVSRPVARCDGAGPCRAEGLPRSALALRLPSVSGGRCSTLVAPSDRPRSAYPLFG